MPMSIDILSLINNKGKISHKNLLKTLYRKYTEDQVKDQVNTILLQLRNEGKVIRITGDSLTDFIYLSKDNYENKLSPEWTIIKDQYAISPIYGGNGRVLVQEDPYKSRFDCTKCEGKRHLGILCPDCQGTFKYISGLRHGKECQECLVPHELGPRPLGYIPCDQCHGQGGTIVIPDESKRNTTTGNILAVSSNDIIHVRVGNKVMFTSYSGSPFRFLDLDLRVIVEKDLLCLVKPLKKSVEGLNEGTFAELENTGVPRS